MPERRAFGARRQVARIARSRYSSHGRYSFQTNAWPLSASTSGIIATRNDIKRAFRISGRRAGISTSSLFKNSIFGSSRGNEAHILSDIRLRSEPPHVGCYIFNGLFDVVWANSGVRLWPVPFPVTSGLRFSSKSEPLPNAQPVRHDCCCPRSVEAELTIT